MRRIDRLWQALESVPCLTALECEWKELLGPELEWAGRFLHPLPEQSESYPCPSPGGDGCPRRVVIHGPGDIVAVCGDWPESCERLTLSLQDIVLHELDMTALGREVAEALGFSARPERHGAATWFLGTWDGEPAYLTLQQSAEDLERAAARLVSEAPGPFVLLAPTRGCWSRQSAALLQRQAGRFVALEEGVVLDGESGFVAAASKEAERASSPPSNTFRPDGDAWELCFAGTCVHLKARRGLRLVRGLLQMPGREVPCWELERSVTGEENLPPPSRGAAVIDEKAQEEYREQIDRLQDQWERAFRRNDLDRAQHIEDEVERIQAAIKAGQGLAGRDRVQHDDAKRAQNRVTTAIRRSLEEISKHHPELSRHLEESLTLGRSLSYRPASETDWLTD